MTDDSQLNNTNEMISDIKKFIKDNYGLNANAEVHTQSKPDNDHGDSSKEHTKESLFDFSLKPKDIKAYLDKYVIGQDEAKKVLSIAVCDHYNHVIQTANSDIP